MRAVDKILFKVLGAGAVISFTALILIVLLQVLARFVLPISPSWTEEASRFLFIYCVAFGAPLALLRNEYVSVDILVKKFSEKTSAILDKSIYILLVIFFAVICYHGITFAELGTIQTSPAMQITMILPYGSIAFSAVFLTWFSLSQFLSRKQK
ncbi:TRAP transporter small permease [Endozoicomonas elysicola]|uniref:TRAP transporter small permease protein n=1 Tax=Endozoicomonas elysicola TaxID=305900 RepID=A0A081KGY5_9GAMM|nr:TRAP transporter small permease [Endozoicomonas elysicola]KEI73411.1 hypothetical protein GV64_24185 [Endozoicomonas elysicola]